MIQSIDYNGLLVADTTLAGHGRDMGIMPMHPNAIQVSQNRFLVFNGTFSLRGTDDQRSILVQIRKDSYDGPVIRERVLAHSVDDWDALGDGRQFVRQHGHPVAFGVPKGALINGQRVAHENVFVIKWRVVARIYDEENGYLLSHHRHPELRRQTQAVEWMQVRLNDSEDDLEILQPPSRFRQKGYEDGEQFCERGELLLINQSFVQAVPFNEDCSQWVDVDHFNFSDHSFASGGVIAPIKHQFNEQTGLYEWVETGPVIGPGPEGGIGEASIVPYNDTWVIFSRCWAPGQVAAMRCDDPFAQAPAIHLIKDIDNNGPITAYQFPDGMVRLFSGDKTRSPHDAARNPLYLFDIDVDQGFAIGNVHTPLDTLAEDLPFPIIYQPQPGPVIDMAKLLPHTGGREQLIACRVRTNGLLALDPEYYCRLHRPTSAEIDACGIHYMQVKYDDELPAIWMFE